MPTSPINDTAPRIQYEAAASQTDFTFPFWVTAENDLAVYVGSAKKELTTDYTVSGVLNTSGGTVSFNVGLNVGEIVTIERAMPFERVSEFQEAGTFKASVLNLELSKLIAMMQQIKGDIGRKMGLSPTSQVSDADLVLPDPVDGKALVFDGASGLMRTSVVNVDDIDTAVTNAQNAATTATSAKDTALQAETDAQNAQTAAETARDEAVAASGKVFATGTDTTSGTLDEKLVAGNGLLKSTLGGGADEDIQLAADYATKAQAEAGTENTKAMTPLRTKQAIDANAPAVKVVAAGNFDGATGSANASSNISLVRNAAGDYSASFGTAEPDTDYIVNITVAGSGSIENVVNMNRAGNAGREAPTVNGFRFAIVNNGGNTLVDPDEIYLTVQRII